MEGLEYLDVGQEKAIESIDNKGRHRYYVGNVYCKDMTEVAARLLED